MDTASPRETIVFHYLLQAITSFLHIEISKEESVQIPGIFICSVDLSARANDRLVQRLQRIGAVSSGFVILEDGVGIAESFHNLCNKVNIPLIIFNRFTATTQEFAPTLIS
jgi:hypothetical protein